MKKNYFKKSLSLVLTVLMLMSCWVFVAPTEADAIDAGDAVTAYNKELLNTINTTVDTNMVTTTNNKYRPNDSDTSKYKGDTNSNVTSTHLANSYQNVLNFNNGNLFTRATGAAVTIIEKTANADSVKVWYPDTVLMYDGGEAKMAVMLEADSNGSSLRTVSCYLDGDSDGLYLGYDKNNPYWRGHSDNDPAAMYCLWIGADGYQATTNGTKHSSYLFGCTGWSFSATHLYFTGTMSDTEWVRTYNPKWSYRGGTSDDSVHGPVTAKGHTIYVMNIQGYKRLVNTISSYKTIVSNKAGQYTRDSLQRFVNACNKITKDLAPKNYVSTTSNDVATWNTEMSKAYTELNNAYSGLVSRNVNVTYENLFSINDWAASASANLQSSSSVEIKVEANNSIKIYKNSAGGEVTTASSYSGNHKDTMYSIPVTGGKQYTVRFNITSSVNGAPTSDIYIFWYDANNNPLKNTAGSDIFNTQRFNDNGLQTVTFTAPANAAKAEIRFDNDSGSSGSTVRFNDIAVYPAERNTAVEVDTWSTRPVTKTVQYGSNLSGKLDVPARKGYTFNGWYIDDVNRNGVKDSGEEVTDAEGNVTKSVTVTNSINLYADWKPLPMDIGYDNMFSLAEWAKSPASTSMNNGTMSYDVMAGTVTITQTAADPTYCYTDHSGNGLYVMKFEPIDAEREFVIKYDYELNSGTAEPYVLAFDTNSSYDGFDDNSEISNGYGVFKVPAGCDAIHLRFGVKSATVGATMTFSNVAVYEKATYDAYAKDYAAVRVPFNFGDTTNLSLVPTRAGYKFEGWFKADGTQLTSVTGLKASDTVYAKWTQLFTVTFKNWNGTVLKTQEVAPGAAATAPNKPNRAADADYEYTFDKWDTDFSKVNSDLVVTAKFTTKNHSLQRRYKSESTCESAATYTQYCSTCSYLWDEVFEDAEAPALGHNYVTVVTNSTTGVDGVHTVACSRVNCNYGADGGPATITAAHTFIVDKNKPAASATCIKLGETHFICTCLETKTVKDEIDPSNHVNTEIINKKDAKCGEEGYTGDKYCNDCEKIVKTGEVIKALEHVYTNYVYNKDATCIADGTKTATCDNSCGTKDTVKAEGTKIPHSFTNYVSNGDAKCGVDGTKTAKCDYNCNVGVDTVTDVGSALEHNFTGAYVTNNNGTHVQKCVNKDCTVTGNEKACEYGAWTKDDAATHSHTCTMCNYTPAAEGHDWSDGWTTVGGSDSEKAAQTRSCKVCGRVENTECKYAESNRQPATCETAERITYTCSDCGHGYTVNGENAKGHKFNGDAVSDNNGNHAFKCSNNCGAVGVGEEKDKYVPCSDWTYANTEAGKHTATCKTCDYVKTEDCSGGEASCTAQAVCQFCNTAYGDKAAHSYTGNTYFEGVEKAQDATCTAQAEYYTYCSACKKSSKGTDKEATFADGDLLPHTFTGNTEFLYKASDAKCEVNETYYVYCSVCKATSKNTVDQATFEKAETALKHVWVNAQHNADTLTHTFTCERACGETMTANCTDSAVSYGYEPATCTEQGYDIVQCSACGHQWNINYTDALGHNYTQEIDDEAHLKSAANCDHANIYYYDCSRCDKNAKDETDTEKYTTLTYLSGEVRQHDWKNVVDDDYHAADATCTAGPKYYPSCSYDDCDAKDISKTFSGGPALGHDFTEMIQDKAHIISAADCVNGSKYYYDCSRCAENAKNDKDSSKYTYTLEDYSGHSMTKTDAKKATCYEAGNLEYWYCDTCKKYYKDAEGKEAYLGQSETVIKKREHDLATFSFKAATCEEDGHPDYVDCKYEDCAYTTLPEELDDGYKAIGHKFTGAYTYDTVNLYHSRLCANGCGVSGMVVDGAQVKFEVTYNGEDEAVIFGGAKCEFTYTESTKDGIHTHANACVCGNNTSKTYSDKETFVETVAPTCTAKGYDSYACKDCAATWTKNEKPANGHTLADKATSNGDGTHSVKCTVEGCGYKTSTEKCSGGQATCKDQAKCEICGGAYGETGTHVYAEGSEWVYQNDAKCGVNGTEKNTCTACGTEVSREAADTAQEHKMTEPGYEVPEALKEELENKGIVIVEPTCGDEGNSISYCEKCYYYETIIVKADKTKHVWATDAEGNKIWNLVSGSCSTGYTYICWCEYNSSCGGVDTKTEPGEHEWAVDSIVRDVCDKYDYIVFKCSKCGDLTRFDATTTDFEIKDENGEAIDLFAKYNISKEKAQHSWSEFKVTKQATCAVIGRQERTCAKCNVVDKEDIPVIAGAHDRANYGTEGNNLKKVAATEATCQREGNYEYFECTRCSFSENVNGKYTIAVLAHEDGNGDGICDNGCKDSIESINSKADGCICHKDNGFMKFIYSILKFFWKLFKMNPVCACGAKHY